MEIKKLSSTLHELEEFSTSAIWLDMKSDMEGWRDDIQAIQNKTNDSNELFRCQGRIEAINNFLLLPSIMLDSKRNEVME